MEKIILFTWVWTLAFLFCSFLSAAETSNSTNPTTKAKYSSPISFGGKLVSMKDLENKLLSQEEFHPFPNIDEREKWDSLPSELRQSLIQKGEIYLSYPWPNLPVTAYLDLRRPGGNRSRYEDLYFARREALMSLVLAECVENKGRFLDQILNGLWTICEETSWVIPAHISMQTSDRLLPNKNEAVIDLFASETGSRLACISYLMESRFKKISPLINKRIQEELKRRILDPYLERDDFRWFGFNVPKVNNWNPWCNSNCLVTFLLMEKDKDRRAQAVAKCLCSLNRLLESYGTDGGCDEGPHYWKVAGGRLFESLYLLNLASNGKLDYFDQEAIRQIGRYICRVHIHNDYYVNFADCPAKIGMNPDLLYRYGDKIGDSDLIHLAGAILPFYKEFNTREESLFQRLFFIFDYSTLLKHQGDKPSYLRDTWFDSIQVMAAREKADDYHGFYLAAKGGNNQENHNHNDVGNFVVYYDGKPLLIDVGVERYTAKTFSSKRYEIWTMQSQYHNLPTIHHVCQQAGEKFKANDVIYTAEENQTKLSMNIGSAYPEKAGIKEIHRVCTLNRNSAGSIDICDTVELMESTPDITWTLMTPCEQKIDNQAGTLTFKMDEKTVFISFDPLLYCCCSEKIAISDERLLPVWGDHIYRILFKSKSPMKEYKWKIHLYSSSSIRDCSKTNGKS